MALCYARLFCRRNFDLGRFRSLYINKSPVLSSTPQTLAVRTTTNAACETHDERNVRLKRPMSPHLTIYQIQLTTLLSITHRTTGIILASYAIGLGLGTLFIPGGIPCVVESIQAMHLPMPVLYVGKTLLALPATYHTFCGLRHLAWDLGMFLTLKHVYSTGYVVAGLSLISALLLAGCSFG